MHPNTINTNTSQFICAAPKIKSNAKKKNTPRKKQQQLNNKQNENKY